MSSEFWRLVRCCDGGETCFMDNAQAVLHILHCEKGPHENEKASLEQMREFNRRVMEEAGEGGSR